MARHPDMVSVDKKAEATKSFQELQSAYQVSGLLSAPLSFIDLRG